MNKEDFLEEEALYQDRNGKDQAIVGWARVDQLRWICVTTVGLTCGPAPAGYPLAHGSLPRLAEKKASIGYTYEDSTVAEVEKVAEKPEEEESPAEEESNSDEDEVIPDIGGVPSLPSPPAVPGHRFCVSSLTLWGTRAYKASPTLPQLQGLSLLLLPAFPVPCLACPLSHVLSLPISGHCSRRFFHLGASPSSST